MSVICMWSGPRNLSTAMMRSFGARADTAVIDEPFFAPFLAVSGKDHPGRTETLERHETDPFIVAETCAAPAPGDKTYVFQKQMPHHMLEGFPLSWAKGAKHFFLLRHPQRVIASYVRGRAEFDLWDLGFAPQRKLYDRLTGLTGEPPPVIDSDDILRDPKKALSKLCAAIDIPFTTTMLSWTAGRHPEDGAWAPYWYHSVEKSTGFGEAPHSMPNLDDQYHEFLSECLDDYQALAAHRILV